MYYPSSQITSNLYTNGDEYIFKSTKQNYVGYYWKTLDGKFFTGKTPQNTPTQELIISPPKYPDESQDNNNISFINTINDEVNDYIIISKKSTSAPLNPTYSPNIPTQKDYDAGEFTRYFCKKTNEIIYLEIDKDTYTKLVNKDPTYLFQLYQPFKFQWVITGDKEKVYIANKNITRYMIEKFSFPFLNKYLKEDYLKYYK